MRTMTIALSILLSASAPVSAAGSAPVTVLSPKTIQLAGSFHNSTAKLGDKSLDGKAGAIYGIGGSEPHVKYFKSRMKKIPRCCSASK